MFNSSPIATWEGAGAFFNWAGSSGSMLWFWVMVALCLVPLAVALCAEKSAEKEHGK